LRIEKFLSMAIILSFSLMQSPEIFAEHGEAATRSTANLKPYMAKFGTMLAGLEIIQLKEKKPDWPAIQLSVQQMDQTLKELQRADATNAYKEYTDNLEAGLAELKIKSQKKDITFFDSLNKISDSCFRCHAAHRPGDYYFPKDKNRMSTDKPVEK